VKAAGDRSAALDAFFAPRSVAVIGATDTPGSVGRTLLRNLLATPFGGTVFPINPKRANVLGIKAYPTIADTPDPVDLAVIATPAPTVPDVVGACAAAGVRCAIVISAGFKEVGPAGAALEQQTLAAARKGNMRLIGPNCLGLMNPHTGLNATFANAAALPGNVGFISQSGALCTAVLDWSLRERVGFSAFVSIGSMLDVGWGDLIDYLGDDPRTNAILLYMESVGDARAFLSAAREVALAKPIVVIKSGRTEDSARAATSHTGALAGSDDVLDAAFRRSGVLRVDTIADLFAMAEVLAKQPRPRGPRLTILTNAGGPGVLATDALIANGGALAPLTPETTEALNAALPAPWSHANPVDVLGDAGPDRYATTLAIIAQDAQSDGLLVMLTPQAMTDPTQTAAEVVRAAQGIRKPVLASWMGGDSVAAGAATLSRAGIPVFAYPDDAARAFAAMWRHSRALQSLYETPSLPPQQRAPDQSAESIIASVRDAGRTLLTEEESKRLLAAYDIPVVPTRAAASEDEAVALAAELGYPVVLKLLSHTVTHKSDVGGVQLRLADADAVRRAYQTIRSAAERVGADSFAGVTVQPMVGGGIELIVGSALDPQFGPVLLFGAGGQLVEVLRDRAIGLPPLTSTLARRLMEQTRIFPALLGVRGQRPVDLEALEHLLVRFSHMVVDQPAIRECDINPLLATPDGAVALDARVVLHKSDVAEGDLPRPAIRPYPGQYVGQWALPDGPTLTIRPIRPEDEPLLAAFHHTLSEESIYQRYMMPLKLDTRVAHERLTRQCFIDYDRAMALVAVRDDEEKGGQAIVAVGRLTRLRRGEAAEFALLVGDGFQRKGIGHELLRRLIEIGRAEGIARIVGFILPDNYGMLRVCKRLGFRTRYTQRIIEASLDV
jgi:acetyltransferase